MKNFGSLYPIKFPEYSLPLAVAMILWIELCIWVNKALVDWNCEIQNHFFKIESFIWQSHPDCCFESGVKNLPTSNYLNWTEHCSYVVQMMDAHYNGESNLQSIIAILENLLFYQKSTIVHLITIFK